MKLQTAFMFSLAELLIFEMIQKHLDRNETEANKEVRFVFVLANWNP